jgi:hypothetical protein
MGQRHAVAKQPLRLLRLAAEDAYPATLEQKPVHHVTANEPRAARDQELRPP